MQTIEHPEPQAIAQWLTYWYAGRHSSAPQAHLAAHRVLFGVITAVEGLLGVVLRYVPLYYILKALLVLWLVAPHTEGALFLWRSYLRPQLARHAPSLMQDRKKKSN